MKRALVTGGAGFLGSNLCARLLAEGYGVLALDNLYTGSRENLADFAGNPAFAFREGDVTELRPDELAGPFDEIYNLACPASPPHYQARPIFTTMTSIRGILLCLALAKREGAKLLHASTSEVYGDALVHPQPESYWGNVNTIGIRSCYDEGKRVAETLVADYIREYDIDARMVRIFNTYGPMMNPGDGRVVSNFICQALRGEDLTVYGTGRQTRSFQYCDDLIEAFRRYMALSKERIREFFGDKRAGGESRWTAAGLSTSGDAAVCHPPIPVINTGNPGEFTMLELAEKVLELVGGRQAYDNGSRPPDACGSAHRSRIVFKPLPSDDPKQRKPDITLAKELLGWEPKVPLAEGLAKTIEYFRKKLTLSN